MTLSARRWKRDHRHKETRVIFEEHPPIKSTLTPFLRNHIADEGHEPLMRGRAGIPMTVVGAFETRSQGRVRDRFRT